MTLAGEEAPISLKKKKTLKLYEEQNGLCWICGMPMLLPKATETKAPNRWEANLDHIGKKNGEKRQIKASHAWCNSSRKHNDLKEINDQIDYVRRKFSNRMFITATFEKSRAKEIINWIDGQITNDPRKG